MVSILLPQDRNWDDRLLNFMYRDEPSVNQVGAEIVYGENGDATITIPGDNLAEGVYVVSVGFDGPGKGRNTVEQTFQVTQPSVKLTIATAAIINMLSFAFILYVLLFLFFLYSKLTSVVSRNRTSNVCCSCRT